MTNPIRVILLTGFLGAGKSTALDRIENYCHLHGLRVTSIENEFAKDGIDGDLLRKKNKNRKVAELSNGCLCCHVKPALVQELDSLTAENLYDCVIIETTGLADPTPLISLFNNTPSLRTNFSLNGIVTLVDAKYFRLSVDKYPECQKQIQHSDVIFINKMDLVSFAELNEVTQQVRGLNGKAQVFCTQNAEVDCEKILSLPEHLMITSDLDDHLHSKVDSVSLTLPGSVDREKFNIWLLELLQEYKYNLLRCKGILSVAGNANSVIVHGVYLSVSSTMAELWENDTCRSCSFVLIGRNLNIAKITQGFETTAYTNGQLEDSETVYASVDHTSNDPPIELSSQLAQTKIRFVPTVYGSEDDCPVCVLRQELDKSIAELQERSFLNYATALLNCLPSSSKLQESVVQVNNSLLQVQMAVTIAIMGQQGLDQVNYSYFYGFETQGFQIPAIELIAFDEYKDQQEIRLKQAELELAKLEDRHQNLLTAMQKFEQQLALDLVFTELKSAYTDVIAHCRSVWVQLEPYLRQRKQNLIRL